MPIFTAKFLADHAHLRMPCSTLNTFPPWSAALTLAQIPALIIRSAPRRTPWRELACFVTKYLPPKSDIFSSWFVYFEKRCVCRRGERIAGSVSISTIRRAWENHRAQKVDVVLQFLHLQKELALSPGHIIHALTREGFTLEQERVTSGRDNFRPPQRANA